MINVFPRLYYLIAGLSDEVFACKSYNLFFINKDVTSFFYSYVSQEIMMLCLNFVHEYLSFCDEGNLQYM